MIDAQGVCLSDFIGRRSAPQGNDATLGAEGGVPTLVEPLPGRRPSPARKGIKAFIAYSPHTRRVHAAVHSSCQNWCYSYVWGDFATIVDYSH